MIGVLPTVGRLARAPRSPASAGALGHRIQRRAGLRRRLPEHQLAGKALARLVQRRARPPPARGYWPARLDRPADTKACWPELSGPAFDPSTASGAMADSAACWADNSCGRWAPGLRWRQGVVRRHGQRRAGFDGEFVRRLTRQAKRALDAAAAAGQATAEPPKPALSRGQI